MERTFYDLEKQLNTELLQNPSTDADTTQEILNIVMNQRHVQNMSQKKAKRSQIQHLSYTSELSILE